MIQLVSLKRFVGVHSLMNLFVPQYSGSWENTVTRPKHCTYFLFLAFQWRGLELERIGPRGKLEQERVELRERGDGQCCNSRNIPQMA